MRKLLVLVALGMFMAGGMIGCEASAKVGDDSTDHGTTVKKTTTVREPDGDRSVRTEVRHD